MEWDYDFSCSISTSTIITGRVMMKYSSVPYFLYALAKPLGDFSFLEEKMRREILNCEEVSFAHCDYNSIAEKVTRDADFYKNIWKGSFVDRTSGEERKIEELRLKTFRERMDISLLMKKLEEEGIIPDELEYIGFIDGTDAFDRPVNVLHSRQKETVISQYWQGLNILEVDEKNTKNIIKDIASLYGVVVSGALRSLLESKNL